MGTSPRKKPARNRPRGIWGERVRSLRQARGWSQMDLAMEVGMFQNKICEIELGQRQLKAETLARLTVALNTSADYLLGLTDSPERRK